MHVSDDDFFKIKYLYYCVLDKDTAGGDDRTRGQHVPAVVRSSPADTYT
jgi:hypothetical protein